MSLERELAVARREIESLKASVASFIRQHDAAMSMFQREPITETTVLLVTADGLHTVTQTPKGFLCGLGTIYCRAIAPSEPKFGVDIAPEDIRHREYRLARYIEFDGRVIPEFHEVKP